MRDAGFEKECGNAAPEWGVDGVPRAGVGAGCAGGDEGLIVHGVDGDASARESCVDGGIADDLVVFVFAVEIERSCVERSGEAQHGLGKVVEAWSGEQTKGDVEAVEIEPEGVEIAEEEVDFDRGPIVLTPLIGADGEERNDAV